MPVEIKELIIRAVVDGGGSDPIAAEGGESASEAGAAGASSDTEAIVEECVRQVMKILARREER